MNDAVRAALPLLIFVLAFLLLIILPARARSRMQQQTRSMQESLAVGTEVMMTCGLYGRVTGLEDDTVDVEVSPGVVMRFARAAVGSVTPKGGDGDEEHSSTSDIDTARNNLPPGQG